MNYWIEQLGFWGYMKQFPVNPITIVGGMILIGIVVLILNAALRRHGSEKFLSEHLDSSIMTFHKRKIGNPDYADNIRIIKLNNMTPQWFFLKPAIPAVYLPLGENKIELYAVWARSSGGTIKLFKSDTVNMTVSVETEEYYSLEYHISDGEFIFEKRDSGTL